MVRNFPSAALALRRAAFFFLGCLMTILGGLPLQAQKPSHLLDGNWVNVDGSSHSLTMIEIAGNRMHLFGECHPAPCAWGVVKARSFTPSVKLGAPAALRGWSNGRFALRELLATLEPDGRMRLEVTVHFTDQSGRGDYRTVDYFVRGRQADSR
jgi:hypothetical protein